MTREQLSQAIIKAWKENAGMEGPPHDGWARIAANAVFDAFINRLIKGDRL